MLDLLVSSLRSQSNSSLHPTSGFRPFCSSSSSNRLQVVLLFLFGASSIISLNYLFLFCFHLSVSIMSRPMSALWLLLANTASSDPQVLEPAPRSQDHLTSPQPSPNPVLSSVAMLYIL